jgi:carboxymethylenebutenolidase
MYTTDQYEGMLAETVAMTGHQGEQINAYYARPLGSGPFPAVVLIHHMPGWDEWYREATRRFAQHGYASICPNLYFRAGHGTPEDVAARVRGEGGVSDEQVLGDVEGALKYLLSQPEGSGKVGLFGTCSGGRHGFLAACRIKGFSAVVDCWGGGVVMSQEELSPKRPVAPIDYTADLSCPLIGIFGNDDHSPTPDQVDTLEAALKQHGKTYEFHRYDGAGHGFFYYHAPAYRQAQAVDGWKKIFAFFEKHLMGA